MPEFQSIDAFVRFLGTRSRAIEEAERKGLDEAGKLVVEEAKSEIGTYQEAVGPFPEWAPLSDATLNGGVSPEGHRYPGKIELGYAPPDNPLLREGALRDAIEHNVEEHAVNVGVPSRQVSPPYGKSVDIGDVARWQEEGTSRMPPRPFLGPAMVRKGHEGAGVVVRHILGALMGGRGPLSR